VRFRACIAIAAVALMASASSMAVSSSPVCGPANTKTLAASQTARVYSSGPWVYGCAAATGRSYRLGQRSTCIGAARVGPVVLAGTMAAYGSEQCGVDTGSAEVIVRRLSNGRTLTQLPATTIGVGAEFYESVTAVVVKRDGAVAWIGVNHSIISKRVAIEVHKDDRAGATLLDSGAGIHTTSLRRDGSRLTWKDGRELRHALLS
jgi:hypothetical protein